MFLVKKQKGITTIEVLITIIITLTIFSLILSIYLLGQQTFREVNEYAELVQNARVTMDRMAREIRQASEIVTVLPIPSEPGTPPNEIEFQDGHDTSQITYIRYYLNGTDLYRQIKVYFFESDPGNYVYWNDEDEFGVGPSSSDLENRIVGEYITNLEFYNFPVIKITETLQKNDNQVDITTNIYGRNL